jgi:hypothetical protein
MTDVAAVNATKNIDVRTIMYMCQQGGVAGKKKLMRATVVERLVTRCSRIQRKEVRMQEPHEAFNGGRRDAWSSRNDDE